MNRLNDYYRGKQSILSRKKQVREEINNKIVINRAYEIVNFKTGYLVGEPIQYVNRSSEEENNPAIILLNEYMAAEDKATEDDSLVEDMHIYGTAYRMVLLDPDSELDEAPFEIYTLDPRDTYVVYYSGVGNKPMMAVMVINQENDNPIYCVYTKTHFYQIQSGRLISTEINKMGDIPIIEYPLNKFRLGSFEVVLDLIDASNLSVSNRLDSIEQFVQALLVLKGVDIDSDQFKALKDQGGLCIPLEADVEYLVEQLSQAETQTLTDDIYQTILTICCMPNRNGGSSTSDTGTAVILRDGFFSAESAAKNTEKMLVKSERQFLKLVLRFCNEVRGTDLRVSDIDIRFTRRNYENIQGKAQVLTTMLGCEKIHPRLAFEHCGMFPDPELAFSMSEEYYQDNLNKQIEELEAATKIPDDEQYIDDYNPNEEVLEQEDLNG